MKRFLLFSALSIGLLSSCSTAYKAGQTPDDVYYSPGRDVPTAREEERAQQAKEEYEEYVSSQDDRYLRMKVANRSRWNSLDDYDYWYDSRYDFCSYNLYNNYSHNPWIPGMGLHLGYGSYWGNPYRFGWNSPVYTLINYSTPKFNPGYTTGSNLSAYRNKSYLNTNNAYNPKTGTYQPANNKNNFGSLLKRVFTNSPSGNNTSYDRPARTFDNSNSRSSSTTPTNSNAGGNSGGFKSTGTSTSTGRGGRG